MAMCKLANVNIVDKTVDFRGNDPKSTVNQTGHIPMMEDGIDKIFGGNNIAYIYLCRKEAKINS